MLAISWIYGIENFCMDIQLMIKKEVSVYWRLCWQFISPTLLSIVLFATIFQWKRSELDGVMFPQWTNAVAAVLIVISIIFIPAMAVHHCVKKEESREIYFNAFVCECIYRWPGEMNYVYLPGDRIFLRFRLIKTGYFRLRRSQRPIGARFLLKTELILGITIGVILRVLVIFVSGREVASIY